MPGSCPRVRLGMHNQLVLHGRAADGSVVAGKRGNSRGAKGPCPWDAESETRRDRLRQDATTEDGEEMSEAFRVNGKSLPPKLFTLRQKLYQKAKREPRFRFYALYDRICRQDVLSAAWAQVARNGGSAGVDGVSIGMIENSPGGSEALVAELHQSLKDKTYRPEAVRRVYIPKPDGRMRPLGIPTVRDRVVQTAAKLILEPIFEADFLDCSHGYRPKRSPKHALRQIESNLREGYTAVYDADLQGYFDTIPHDKLMKAVEQRVADRSVLSLIRMWLGVPVEDRDEDGRRTVSRSKQGTPQGRGDLAAAGQPVPPLVRYGIPPKPRAGNVGESPSGPLRRRLRHHGALRRAADYRLGGKNHRRMAWPDDQPKQDSGGERDPAERAKPGFRGLYLPLRPGPPRKRDPLPGGVSLGQGGSTPQGADAGAGRQEAVLHAAG